MEIKILCSCGNKYKFDLEPVNGRAPNNLSCPQCKASWTDYANAFIARELGVPPAPAPSAAAPPPAPPRPVSLPAMPSATQPPAPGRISLSPTPTGDAQAAGKISLSIAAPEPAPAPRISLSPATAPAEAEAALAPAPAGESTPAPIRPMPAVPKFVPAPSDAEGGLTPGFGLGILGGLLGATLGGLIFYLVFHFTGSEIKLVAIGVGFFAGLGARLLGKKGCMELGIITAILTIAGIFGAEYLFAKNLWNEFGETSSKSGYEDRIAEAKAVVKAVPNETDEEIRNYLAKENADPDEKPDPRAVTKEQIREFREKVLPEERDYASGKITKEEFEKKEQAKLAKFADKDKTDPDEEKKKQDTYFNYFFVIVFLNRFNLVCIAAAVGLAYKMTDS